MYYKQEKNIGRDIRVKTGKVVNVEIKLKHKVNIQNSEKDKRIKHIEKYDVEITYDDGLKTYISEEKKINYSSKTDDGVLKEYKFTKKKKKV